MPIKINPNNPYSTIKTINHALITIGGTFGTDAHQLDQMRALLDIELGADATFINGKGQLKMRNTAEIRARISDPEVAKSISNIQTAAEYKKAAAHRMEENTGIKADRRKMSKEEREEYDQAVIEHEKMVDAVKYAAESEKIKTILSAQKAQGVDVSGSKSYSELFDLISQDLPPETAEESADNTADDSSEKGAKFADKTYNAKNENWIDNKRDSFNGGIGKVEKF